MSTRCIPTRWKNPHPVSRRVLSLKVAASCQRRPLLGHNETESACNPTARMSLRLVCPTARSANPRHLRSSGSWCDGWTEPDTGCRSHRAAGFFGPPGIGANGVPSVAASSGHGISPRHASDRTRLRGGACRSLRQAALPSLRWLHHNTGFVVHLGVLDGTDVVYLEKIGGESIPDIQSRVGS